MYYELDENGTLPDATPFAVAFRPADPSWSTAFPSITYYLYRCCVVGDLSLAPWTDVHAGSLIHSEAKRAWTLIESFMDPLVTRMLMVLCRHTGDVDIVSEFYEPICR
jgi:hypothetical protein